MKYLLCPVLLCIVLTYAAGQQITAGEDLEYIIQEVRMPGGSLGNSVNCVAQGPDGFVWFGTHGGLHRFDGYEFVTYKPDLGDTVGKTTSLTFPYVESLYWDKSNFLWVGSYGGGLYRFDPITETFTHYKHDPKDSASLSDRFVTAMIEDAQGNLWVGTERGLNRLDRKTGKFKRYHADHSNPKALFSADIRNMYVDKQGILWLASGFVFFPNQRGALTRYDQATDSFTNYVHDPKDERSLWGNCVRGILEDSQGNFWVAAQNGLCKFDRIKGTFERMNRDKTEPHAPGTFEQRVSAPQVIFEPKDGGLWVSTIFNQDGRTNLVRFDTKSKGQQVLPIPTSVWCLIESSDGTMWAGGGGIGGVVYKVFPKSKTFKFQHGDFTSSNEFQQSEMLKGLAIRGPIISGFDDVVVDTLRKKTWIECNLFTMGRTYYILANYDHVKKNTTFYHLAGLSSKQDDSNPAASWAAHGMAVDNAGRIWGIVDSPESAIYRYDPQIGKTTQYVHKPGDSTSLSSNNVVSMIMDRRGYVWVAAFNAGLNRLDPKTGLVKQFHFSTQPNFDFPIALLEAADGKIWVGGTFNKNGLPFMAVIDPATDQVEQINWSDKPWTNSVLNLTQSPITGNIYFSLDAELLGTYFPSRKTFQIALCPLITDLQCDRQGVIWAATGRSFIRILENSGDGGFSFHDPDKGEIQSRSGLLGQDGHIYFTTRPTGWIEIDPASIIPEQTNDSLHTELVDLFVQGEKIRAKPGTYLPKPISTLDEIRLPNDIGSFLFKFSDFDFQKALPQFQYRLIPYEEEWNKTTQSPTANYYRVPPGTYTFQVQSIRQNQLGNLITRELKVVILPPWWRTWWAYGLYGASFIFGALVVHRTQKARVIKAERERTRDRELAQAKEIEKAYADLKATQSQLIQSEKMASLGELTAGIAHEIQNPLNFINNFSEVNSELIAEMKEALSKGNAEEANSIAKTIEENETKIVFHGKRADGIVKGMLQHSRASSGVKEPTDLNALADEYLRLAYHGLRAKDKSFNASMKTDFDGTVGKIKVVPQEIGRVVLNLITNAFYVVTERKRLQEPGYEPTVSVRTSRQGNKLFISVKDNGMGVPQKVLDKIFQPFFTTKPAGQGTGLGLSLSYDIVKAHGGELRVETKEGEGSTFIIELPITT